MGFTGRQAQIKIKYRLRALEHWGFRGVSTHYLHTTSIFSSVSTCRWLKYSHGKYVHTEELLALEAISVKGCQRDTASSPHITRFLPLDEWSLYLNQHPDKAFAAFMESGLSHGFCIRFDHTSTLQPAPLNFHSVQANPATVERYMAGEIAPCHLVAS